MYLKIYLRRSGSISQRQADWHVLFDLDPVMAAETRRRIYDQFVADKILIHGSHFPFPALVYIEKNGSAYREVPVLWSPAV